MYCSYHLIRKHIHFIEMIFHSFQLLFESLSKKSIYVRQRGLIRPEFFLPGDGVIALRDRLASVPWYARVTLDVEATSVLKYPRQREGLAVLKRLYEEYIVSRVASRETQGTKIPPKAHVREKTVYEGASPYV